MKSEFILLSPYQKEKEKHIEKPYQMRFYFWCLFCCVSIISQHVWNIISCNSAVQCQLSRTFENGFSFVDTEGNEINGLLANNTYQFGLVLTPNASLTCFIR